MDANKRHSAPMSFVSSRDASSQDPDCKVHGANTGPAWILSAPDGPHDGPMNLAIRGTIYASPSRTFHVYSHLVPRGVSSTWRLFLYLLQRLYKTVALNVTLLWVVHVYMECFFDIVRSSINQIHHVVDIQTLGNFSQSFHIGFSVWHNAYSTKWLQTRVALLI